MTKEIKGTPVFEDITTKKGAKEIINSLKEIRSSLETRINFRGGLFFGLIFGILGGYLSTFIYNEIILTLSRTTQFIINIVLLILTTIACYFFIRIHKKDMGGFKQLNKNIDMWGNRLEKLYSKK